MEDTDKMEERAKWNRQTKWKRQSEETKRYKLEETKCDKWKRQPSSIYSRRRNLIYC